MIKHQQELQNQVILSQIPLSEIFEGLRAIIREEINAEKSINQEVGKEIIDSKELTKRLNISEPTLFKWRQKKRCLLFKSAVQFATTGRQL